MIHAPSPNADARPPGAVVDHLVLHYTGMKTAAAALARLCDPEAKVSAHYLLDEDGEVYALVPEASRAWHAGVSYWRGVRQLNDRSIGIEIVNPGHEWGYRPFPPAQMASLAALCHGICSRHDIPARNVVGHSDIAPDRKQDPGELFDWRWLARQGVGVWTDAFVPSASLAADLQVIGYDPALPLALTITAFQRHFLPEAVTGHTDAATAGRAAAVRALVDAAPLKRAGNCHPDGWAAAAGVCASVEESPGSTEKRCRLTAGGGDPRDSATENKPPIRPRPGR